MKRLLTATLLAAGALAPLAGTVSAQNPAVTYATVGTLNDSRPFTLGFSFNLSSSMTVTHLGVWAGGTLGDYLAGIWKSDGTAIVSTNVLGSDPMSSGYRWGSIAPTVLGPGDYVVAAEFRGGDFPFAATGVSRVPGFNWGTDLQVYGSGLNFPTVSTGGGYGDNGILWANLAVSTVPEPSTWALMVVGLAAMGITSRRRRAVR